MRVAAFASVARQKLERHSVKQAYSYKSSLLVHDKEPSQGGNFVHQGKTQSAASGSRFLIIIAFAHCGFVILDHND